MAFVALPGSEKLGKRKKKSIDEGRGEGGSTKTSVKTSAPEVAGHPVVITADGQGGAPRAAIFFPAF